MSKPGRDREVAIKYNSGMNGESDNPTSQGSDALLGRCIAGESQAWGELVDSYAGLVHSVARTQGLNEDECDDVTQVVFAILFRRLGSIQDRAALPKWLMVTTRRECWRHRRAGLRNLGIRIDHAEMLPAREDDAAAERQEQRSLVRAGLALLGERCRRLLTALFGEAEPETYAAISERLGIPVGSIGPTRARCLKELMGKIEELEG